jgi:hypothetical protein
MGVEGSGHGRKNQEALKVKSTGLGSGFGVHGSGFRDQGSRSRVEGRGFRVYVP